MADINLFQHATFSVAYTKNEYPSVPDKPFMPDKRLFPDKYMDVTREFQSLEQALMFYSQTTGMDTKILNIIWDNNESGTRYDPMDFYEFPILEEVCGFSQICNVLDFNNDDKLWAVIHSPEFNTIRNRLEQYISQEDMKLPKTFFIDSYAKVNIGTERDVRYLQTALKGENSIECKFYDKDLILCQQKSIPFAGTNTELFKDTLASSLQKDMNISMSLLQHVNNERFNELAKEAIQRDGFYKLGIDDKLLQALRDHNWTVSVNLTDFFYEVEFAKTTQKLNIAFYMKPGDSLLENVQECVVAKSREQSPFSEEITKMYQNSYQDLLAVVSDWHQQTAEEKEVWKQLFGDDICESSFKPSITADNVRIEKVHEPMDIDSENHGFIISLQSDVDLSELFPDTIPPHLANTYNLEATVLDSGTLKVCAMDYDNLKMNDYSLDESEIGALNQIISDYIEDCTDINIVDCYNEYKKNAVNQAREEVSL